MARNPLLDRVGRWPLALSMLNGVLSSHMRRRVPIDQAFREMDTALTRFGVGLLDEFGDRDVGPGIAGTLGLSFDELAATSPHGQASLERYIALAAFPERLAVPYGLLESLWGLDTVATAHECERFFRHSLVIELDETGVRLHDVIRDYLRRTHPTKIREASSGLLVSVRPVGGWHYAASTVRQQLAHHLLEAGLVAELATLCTDLRYLARRVEADGVHAAEADVTACMAARPADRVLTDLLAMLRSHSHLFGADPALTLYCHLFGRVALTHVDEALPPWSLRPTRPLPTGFTDGLARTLVGHRGQVTSVQWMADETLATVGGDDGMLRLWDPDTGKTESAAAVSEHLVLRSRLSPDGRLLAQLVYEYPLIGKGRPSAKPTWVLRTVITDVDDGSVIAVDELPWIDMFLKGMTDLHWRADSELLAVAGGGQLRIWRPGREPSTSPTQTHNVAVQSLSWHPEAGLAGLTHYGQLYVWADPTSSAKPRLIELTADSADPPQAMVWSWDARQLAVASEFALAIVDAETWRYALGTGPGFWDNGAVCRIAWQPGGHAVAVAGNVTLGGGLVTCWDLTSPQPVTIVDTRVAAVLDIAWRPDGKVLAVASVDSTVRLWDKPTRGTNQRLPNPFIHRSQPPRGVLYGSLRSGVMVSSSMAVKRHTDHTLVATNADGLLAVEANETAEFARDMSSTQACSDWGVAQNVACKVFGIPGQRLELRSIPDRTLLRSIVWEKPRCLAVNPARTILVTTTEDGQITAYNLCTFDPLCALAIDDQVIACWFSTTGDRLLVQGYNGDYAFWAPTE